MATRTDISILGAGIAGLSLAGALQLQGVTATVFERAPQFNEIGAGLQLSPNATLLLGRLGVLEQLRDQGVEPDAIEIRRWADDTLLHRTVLGSTCAKKFGAPYLCVARADLHAALISAVGKTPITLGKECSAVSRTVDGMQLSFADGTTHDSDVVVGADGIRSTVRQVLSEDQPRFTGSVAYRAVVKPDRLDTTSVTIWLGPGRHFVAYPIGRGRLSIAASVRSEHRPEIWQSVATPEELLAEYADWCPRVRNTVSAVKTVGRWALHDRGRVGAWHDDRTVLIGDAAHPMLPFGAQGAAQAIEDAFALAAVFAQASRPGRATDAFTSYTQTRKQRLAAVVEFVQGNARNHHLSDGTDQTNRDRDMSELWGLKRQEWLYGYDAQAAIEVA